MNQAIKDFLKENKLTPESVNTQSCIADYLSEMEKGLAGDESSLAMIASYVDPSPELVTNKPVIVLDAGGTNLRVCTVYFNEQGEAVIENFSKYPMPGIEKELSADEFYNTICDYLTPVIELANNISFCFSYPTEIAENQDGKLLYWTKEVKVPEVVGKFIGEGLIAELEKRGHTGKKVNILNDTVATLLAGKAYGESRGCDGYVGLILGTGTNTAYVELNQNIGKIGTDAGSQIINIESGNFSKAPLGDIDGQLDADTDNPGLYVFEKTISGRYLGAAVSYTIRAAAKQGLLSAELATCPDFETEALSLFLANPHTNELVENLSSDNKEAIYTIATNIVARAAKLTAINIAGTALKMDAGHSPLAPICVNIDGSTYFKLHGFSAVCEAYVADIMAEQNRHYVITTTDNAPVIGTAIAGVVNI